MEDLGAELGAAFLCADLDLRPTAAQASSSDDAATEHMEEHASYIASWLKVLKNDNRAIFATASHTQRAADFLNASHPARADQTQAEPPLA